ncbi:MAG: ABC transporter permease [Desulfurococcales archaeon]|nr:ABC transporter permease [Desulfurococcales archaeon]
MIAPLLALVAYNLRVILHSRREFIITPLVIAIVSVTIIPYGLSKYVGEGEVAVVVSTGLILGAILLPSMVAAFYSVMEITLGSFEKYMLLPVSRYTIILARIISITILNVMVTTIALSLAAALHGLKITTIIALTTYLSSATLTLGITGITLVLTGGVANLERASLTISVLSILLADASPILFPLNALPTWTQILLILNPVTSAVEVLRSTVLERWPDTTMILTLLIINFAWIIAGLKTLITRLEKL